ncbi:AMP-binding protein [Actinophytocola sp.]|uniref:AMP-binding protein n=1 Tax=Actinophytocola sp. TaxID=1872138 RepID=UPI003D6A40E7
MSLELSLPATTGVPFARELRSHGGRIAVAGSQGVLTYTELADRVDAVAAELGSGRKLVLLAARNDLDSLVTYLAALAGGHPIVLTGADDPASSRELAAAYDPDVLAGASGLEVRRSESAHEPHPELAVLLSTSGSTGSRKLVRLSAENLQSNAGAIGQYLGIRPDDRAPTTLPMQYCYGLSVINSNLLAGAGLLLTDASVVDEDFWEFLRAHGGTSLHGVPYTFELLESSGFADLALPSLRYVTQAGGKLAPERVRAFAELGRRHGWRLFVMYGQTEATARMGYLDPELAATRPDAVGGPIPGGSFEIAGGGDEGELLYRGPNVMLGYATSPADLAAGRTADVLATGDLARRGPDGLWEITGRVSRFVKICGLRVDLDGLERGLAAGGLRAACTGDDQRLVIGLETPQASSETEPETEPEVVRRRIARQLGLPDDRVLVLARPELPRTANGKVDYPALRAAVPPVVTPRVRRRETVRRVYARVLHLEPATVRDDDTFVGLGGDSLHYVQAALRLERLLGDLPATWPTTTVAELERRAPRRGLFAAVETSIVLRALAILLVIGTHLGLYHLMGGAHLLLVLAGWSFGRFCVPRGEAEGAPSRRIARSMLRVAVPSMLWIAWRATSQWDTGVVSALLVSGYVGKPWTIAYWYIEVLVHILLALSLLFAVPAVRRFDQRHRLALPLLVLAAGCVLRLVGFLPPGAVLWWLTHQVLWVFALGWLAQRTRTVTEQLLVLAAAVVMMFGYFTDPWRNSVVLVGLAAVLFIPRTRLPRLLARPIGLVASASLYIYLTHYMLIPQVPVAVGSWLATGIALTIGIVIWLGAEAATRGARDLLRSARWGEWPRTSTALRR